MNETKKEMERLDQELRRRYEKLLGETCTVNDIVYVEAGEKEVKVVNFGFDLRIPNGYDGEGTIQNPIVILEPGFSVERCHVELFVFRMMQGRIDIYESDCGRGSDKVIKTLLGKYTIYYKDGVVFFAKWKDE